MTTQESNRWQISETIALLAIWGDESVLRRFDGTIRDTEVYRLISERLVDQGYRRSVSQVKGKMKNLKKEFRKVQKDLNLSGSEKKIKFKYYDSLSKIMGGQPLCTAESSPNDDVDSCENSSVAEGIDFITSQSELEDTPRIEDIKVEPQSISEETPKIIACQPLFTSEPNDDINSCSIFPDNAYATEGINFTPNLSELEDTSRLDNVKIEESQSISEETPEIVTCQPLLTSESSLPNHNIYSCNNAYAAAEINFTPSNSQMEDMPGLNVKEEESQSISPDTAKIISTGESSPQKRKKVSIKEFIKTTISSTVDKFMFFEKEIEDRNFERNKKFQEQLLELEREKINLFKLYVEK